MRGFALANVQPGVEPEFFANLAKIQQVVSVFYLFDDYDYLIEVEAPSDEELVDVLARGIRHLPGVVRSASFRVGNALGLEPVRRETAEPSSGAERTIFHPVRSATAR
jgi:DNA-binding Lrp family transcriptional regulator